MIARTKPGGGARLEIALLGGWSARAAGRALDLPTKKSQALLAYLALRQGRPHERETLRALLWSESPKPQAQASLRQALLALRRALPVSLQSALLVSGASVTLDPARTWVDVAALKRALEESTRPALERAAELFQGPLLDGFLLGEAPFEEWLEVERARLHATMLGALERLAQLQSDEGDLERALQTTLRALRLEPLEERAHRAVMRLYASQGRRAEALQQYEQCAALLERELGVEPDEQTKTLHRELLRGAPAQRAVACEPHEERLRAAAGAGPRGAAPGEAVIARRVADITLARDGARPFVGREPELAWLEQALSAAAAGETWFSLVRGDAGIGKTRLIEVLAARTRARCVRGRCFESEQVLPFALWADLLRGERSLTDDDVLRELSAVQRAELGRLLPAAADPSTPAPPLVDARLLFEACGELLRRAAQPGPLLVLLEDLHWADGMSLRLLSFLVRRAAPGARVCVIGTARAEELSGAADLRQLLHELGREQLVRELALGPLRRGEALALVQALQAGASIDAGAREQVVALSEGNPLVIVECMRGWAAGAGPGPAQQLPVPERVRALIEHHVERLTPAARAALHVAAVIGRAFAFELLARASGDDADELARGAEELVQRRVVESTESGLYFAHDRIREVVYASILPARRALLHGAVARALEQLHAEHLDEVAGSIGYHYARAAQAAPSVAFLQRFARRCSRNYGLGEALAALEEAQRQSALLPAETRDPSALELAIARCECLMHLGRTVDVEAVLAPFGSSVERLARPALAGPFHAWLGLAKGFLGEGSSAREHGARALAEAERCADVRTAGLAHSLLSLEASHSGHFQRGIEHGLRAVAMLDPDTTDHQFAAFAYIHLGLNQLNVGACAPALASFRSARAIGERAQSARLRCMALGLDGVARVCAGEFDAGLPACKEAVGLAPDPHSAWSTHLMLVRAFGLASGARGDPRLLREPLYARSVAALEASLEISGGPSVRALAGRTMVALAGAYLAQQEPERARHMAARALAQLQVVEDPLGLAAVHRVQGMAALARGDLKTAAAEISEASRSFEALGARLERALAGLPSALIARFRGDGQTAVREIELAVQIFGELELPHWVALVRERMSGPRP